MIVGMMTIVIGFGGPKAIRCSDDSFTPSIVKGTQLPYGNATYGFICSVEDGPLSFIRRGLAEDVSVILSPTVFPFGAATFLAFFCMGLSLLAIFSMCYGYEPCLDDNSFVRHIFVSPRPRLLFININNEIVGVSWHR